MKPRLAFVLLLLVCLPLGLFAWLGMEMSHGEQARVRERFTEVLRERLEDVDKRIAERVRKHQRHLDSLLQVEPQAPGQETISRTSPEQAQKFRQIVADNRLVNSFFAFDAQGRLAHPPPDDSVRTQEERAFLERTQSIWAMGKTLGLRNDESALLHEEGWHVWFWGNGANYLYWKRLPGGETIGVEVDRIALMSSVVAALPADAGPKSAIDDGRIKLTDAQSRTIYQWGNFEPKPDGKATVSFPVSLPFKSWRLDYFTPALVGEGLAASTTFNIAGGLIAAAAALVILGFYFFREHRREMQTAEQRVSFVNQVSHELKTPLTNICMYAELAEQKLPDDASESAECLDVVVSESERLSRLIRNVLTFSKGQRKGLKLSKKPGVLDDVIHSTIEHFRPSLAQKNVEVALDLQAAETRSIDSDAVEQILGNLISNVEKYAGDGGKLEIKSTVNGASASVSIRDFGNGIPAGSRGKIFEPFYRCSDMVSDGVSGTGIGLSISRELARLHGGDLILRESECGAHFELSLAVDNPAANGPSKSPSLPS